MTFTSGKTSISLTYVRCRFIKTEDKVFSKCGTTKVLDISFSYVSPDGFGLILEEYVRVDDIFKMIQGLKRLEFGVTDSFQMEFFGSCQTHPLITVQLDKTAFSYHLDLKVYDAVFEDDISVNRMYTLEEWEPYSVRLAELGRICSSKANG